MGAQESPAVEAARAMLPLKTIRVEGVLTRIFDCVTTPDGAKNRNLWVLCKSEWGPQSLQVQVRGTCATHEFHKGRCYGFDCRLYGHTSRDKVTGQEKNSRTLRCGNYTKFPLVDPSVSQHETGK